MKRRRLGQHYLVDGQTIRNLIDLARIKPTEKVLEIGTGKGALTRHLAVVCGTLEAYEVDEENYLATSKSVKAENVVVHLGDVFRQRPRFDVLVSSLPYSESATFVEWLAVAVFDRAVVVLQRDFVDKLLTPPGSRDYRAVSAIAQISCEIHQLARVRRDAFSPPPRVDSVVASFTPRFRMTEEEISNVKRLFSLRRRQIDSALAEVGIENDGQGYGHRRVYSLSPLEVHRLCLPKGHP